MVKANIPVLPSVDILSVEPQCLGAGDRCDGNRFGPGPGGGIREGAQANSRRGRVVGDCCWYRSITFVAVCEATSGVEGEEFESFVCV